MAATKEEAAGALGFMKQTFKEFGDDECAMRAASLSYYIVFALAPLLLLIILVASVFVDAETVRRTIQEQFAGMIGQDTADQVSAMIGAADEKQGKGLSSVLSTAALIFGATGAFMQLQSALNRAWEVEPDPKAGGIKNFIFKRVLSLGMIMGIAFMLLVSLALSAFISAAGSALGSMLGGLGTIVQAVLDLGLSLVVVTLLFAAMFKFLPDGKIAWKDVWVGAFFTAALFTVGKFGIGLYLGRSDPGQGFGAAASLAVLLVWVYYSSMILLFGAEFTQTWAVRKGSGIEPKKGARRMADETGGEEDQRQPSQRGKGGGKRSHSAGKQPSPAAPAGNAGHRKKRKTPLLDARRREIAEKEARGEE
ncbi:MAG TPA: YihY/virulence factor BrkB family protein [Longimicrobium sp.]|jgi:membrane protein